MSRSLSRVLWFVCLWLVLPSLAAQDLSRDQFRIDFNKAIELADEKMIDKAVKRGSYHALNYYEALYWEKDAGKADAAAKCLALQASWKRCFENGDTVEQLDRWLSGSDNQSRQLLQRSRDQSYKLWVNYSDVISKDLKKPEYEQAMQQFMDLARNAESIGHAMEIAEQWNFASVVGFKMPDKNLTNRRDVLFAMEQFVEARKRWNLTFDDHYVRAVQFVKDEKVRLVEDEKLGEKKKAEGYAADSKGVESLVVPNVAEVKHPLKFEAMATIEEPDFGSRTGPLPAFWWMASVGKAGTSAAMPWFRKRTIYLHRTGPAKAGIAFDSGETKNIMPVDISSKGKVSTFWLDADKKMPYAMVFWTGSDREMVNDAECNLQPSDMVCNVYYHSASSWKTTIGTDQVTLYDDNANGNPGDSNPFDPEYKVNTLGEHDTDGTVVPLLDSMRVGKGPRMPYSEFVKLATGWVHMKKGNGDEVGVRPFNPEYVKPGKIKVVWAGAKPTAPTQLVVRGVGDLQTAMFDVAGGKEVEVPAGEYGVLWGRIQIGKGARSQVATIYAGKSQPFKVEADKVYELKMGAPFTLEFNRRGDENATLHALKILLVESSGCILSELHGINLACEVLAAKEADGKGATVVGKFVRFTDPELVNKAAGRHNRVGTLVATFPMPEGYRDGELELKLAKPLPAPGMKLSLSIKKHPLLGDVKSAWQ
jgi:hypothetical protein